MTICISIYFVEDTIDTVDGIAKFLIILMQSSNFLSSWPEIGLMFKYLGFTSIS